MKTRAHLYCTVGRRGFTLHIIDSHFPDRTVCGHTGDLHPRDGALVLLGPSSRPLCRNCERMKDATSV